MITPKLDDVSRLVDSFYAAAFDDSLWRPALDELGSMLDVRTTALGWQDFRTGSLHLVHGDCGVRYHELFLELSATSPIQTWMRRQPVNNTFTEDQFIDRAEVERLAFYGEWMEPQQTASALVTRLAAAPATGGYLLLGGRRRFDESAIALMDLLAPALSRVLELRARAGAINLTRRADTFDRLGLGLFIVNRDRRVLHSNRTADHFAESGMGIGIIGGRLTAKAESEQLRLRQLIENTAPQVMATCAEGGDMVLSSPDTAGPVYAVSVRPVPDAASYGLDAARAAMIVLQPVGGNLRPGFEESIRAMFGLSPREAELAAALAGGRSLKQAAAYRQISMATARTQLAAIFKKTNTTQQSQLVALLLGILPVAH